MGLGFKAKLTAPKCAGFLPGRVDFDALHQAALRIREEDFAIPDSAADAGLHKPRTDAASVSRCGNTLKIGFPCGAELCFTLSGRHLFADTSDNVVFGPGFHVMALNFCRRLAEESTLKLSVADETGYFTHGDFKLLKQAFAEWFRQLIVYVLSNREEQMHSHYLCWRMDHYTIRDRLPGIVTPGGFFRYDQLPAMAENPERAADDFFVFLPNAEKDALHYRNAAMRRLWCDFRFTGDEADRMLGTAIAEDLETAAALDSTLPFPKKAYLELCSLLKRRPVSLDPLAEDTRFPTVGYRKLFLLHSFCHWQIGMPGFLRTELTDTGSFHAESQGLHLWFSELSFRQPDHAPDLPPLYPHEGDRNRILEKRCSANRESLLVRTRSPEYPLMIDGAVLEHDPDDRASCRKLIFTAYCASRAEAALADSIFEQCVLAPAPS